ncbi:DNA polymerase domain-containing protein [Geobacter sp. DSM 9736]|uniref:DNA polymerase domain-containing protein n=1 Tax=Geobacter sp. DSM 9736 TaxID=1277350 RepID=UPI000B5020BE|nr:DNA polymerase domain-containing protein [Geobacter sp. DSM 9736]SNB47842.1 DNA polymerase elongation subunit (family B) [Geobacter sp. DSM 9736]
MERFEFEGDALLFGRDPTENIVAAELAGRFVRLFIRDDSGLRFHDEPFHPFLLLDEPGRLDGFPGDVTFRRLQGEGAFRHIAFFRDWRDCIAAKSFISQVTLRTPSAPDAPYVWIPDPVHQHLLITGKTLFKGLEFGKLRRLALDIETWCGENFEFPNAERETDRIVSIALMDGDGFSRVLSGDQMSEREMLEELNVLIRHNDPDVIEGHNIFCFDLEYIRVRAQRHGVSLSWGRDGSSPRITPSRFSIADRSIDYPRWNVYGRHIIDTYFLLQIHDVGSRDLDGYGLKAAAVHFGLAQPDRVYLDRRHINRVFAEEPELLRQYNLDDVRETLALSRLLSYPFFLQTRIFPYSYQNCIVRGNATKINSLLVREYLRRGAAIPRQERREGAEGFEGGYTEILREGVVRPVVHCDVASLYPSLILVYRLSPASDRLGVFLSLLKDLRNFRLEAKRGARSASSRETRDYFQALQQVFKVLINSFYGYLGTSIHNFADPAAAARVTALGRETIVEMVRWLKERGAEPVEVDTDGIYFIPPSDVGTLAEEEALVRKLSESLPQGIEVEHSGRYRAMFSYKMKNYALLAYDGRVTVKGSALKSRGMERYLRQFMEDMIRLLLAGEGERVEELYAEYLERLRKHDFPIEWLSRTETLSESPASYSQKVGQGKRNPSAAFETALATGLGYRSGDRVAYYIAGSRRDIPAYGACKPAWAYDPGAPDENTAYYADKLYRLKKRFDRFLPQEPTLFD